MKYIVSSLYDDGILNKNIAQYLAKNPEICSNKLLSSVIDSKDFYKDERKELNKELTAACSNFEKFKRIYEIHESLNRPAYSLSDVAKQAAAQHYETAKSFDDADKEIAKVLVCADFNEIDKDRHIKQLAENVAKRLGKSSGSISRAEIIADVITRTLPQTLNYKDSMEKNIELVNNAQKGLNNELTKAKIKTESKSKGKENFKSKTESKQAELD